ncbi:replication initiation protein [Spiroplasma endosymbiont of Dasysyrphus albostriatus]|uniref:replication initiation protein n=1 Tax=Spiroplasma endosymbiont of Dasysyrphus albostriatus TaxID=3066299 RepID=UPI0030CB98FE
MAIELSKEKNKFIKKSNVIVRTITNDTSGLLTQRLFNFAISSIKFNTNFNGVIKVNLNDFCIFHNINNTNLYEKVIHKKKEMTIIEKEIDNITSLKFWLQDENKEEYSFINLFERGTWFKNQGILEFKVVQDLIKKHYIDLKKDYTNIYLPYTKTVTSKYSMRLYEYLRSYLYMNAKTKITPNFNHEWDYEKLAKILNLNLKSSYFKQINMLKTRILEPVKKDLEKTDIIFTYELIKVGRKYSRIILNTHLDLEKFNAQNPELEKVLTKKEQIKKEKSLSFFTSKIKKNQNIEQSILSDDEIKKIMQDFDNH